jgi:hypothetical protein
MAKKTNSIGTIDGEAVRACLNCAEPISTVERFLGFGVTPCVRRSHRKFCTTRCGKQYRYLRIRLRQRCARCGKRNVTNTYCASCKRQINTASYRERHAGYNRKHRQKLEDAGICKICGRTPVTGTKHCMACLDIARHRQKGRKRRSRAVAS